MRSEARRAMRLLSRMAGIVALVALLPACDNILNDDDQEDTFHIRSINLVENSPNLQFDLDDTAISTIGYGGATDFSAAHPGRRDVTFEAILPSDLDDDDDDDDTTTPVGPTDSYTFLDDTPYTLIAYGKLDNIHTFIIEGLQQRDSVDDERLVLQFVHAAPDAPQVDVYITAAQAGIATRQYVDTLSLSEASAPLELTLQRDDDELDDDATLVADVVVELVETGTGQSIYRSDAMSLSEKSRLLFAIANTNGPGPSPVKLVLAGSGSGQELDRQDGAAIRFVHASSDTPALDVNVGDGLDEPLARNVGYGQAGDYLRIDDGEVGMVALPAGAASPFVFFEEFTAVAGNYYTAYALGPRSEVDAVVYAATAKSIPTQAAFRFLHGAASLENEDALDVYLRLPGEGVDFDDDDTTPSYNLAYQGITSYTALKAGDYDVYFALSGTSTIVLGPTSFHVDNGAVTTLVLLDSPNGGLALMPVSDVASD